MGVRDLRQYLGSSRASEEIRQADRLRSPWRSARPTLATSRGPTLYALLKLLAACRGSSCGRFDQRAPPHEELPVPIRLPSLELASADRAAKRRLGKRHERERVSQEEQP